MTFHRSATKDKLTSCSEKISKLETAEFEFENERIILKEEKSNLETEKNEVLKRFLSDELHYVLPMYFIFYISFKILYNVPRKMQ